MFEMMAGRSPFDTGAPMGADNPDQNTEELLFQVILEKVIRIPRSLSVRAAKVLKEFLTKNPEERLGCGEGKFQDIINHDFFRTIDWTMLERKQVTPVSFLVVQCGADLKNIFSHINHLCEMKWDWTMLILNSQMNQHDLHQIHQTFSKKFAKQILRDSNTLIHC